MRKYIPLSVPTIGGNEWNYVKECLDTEWVSSAGKYVDLFEQKISEYTGSKYSIACVNGTSALQVSLRLSGVEPGDEVLAPTITFIAPVNAIIYNNAIPVFFDSDEYYNINIDKVIDFFEKETFFKGGFTYNKRTKNKIAAIIPVHVWGNASNIFEIQNFCQERNIKIIEDASESLGTFYKNKPFSKKHTGTIGDFGCISFNGNKIITCGGGGIILTNDEEKAEKAKYLSTQAKSDPVYYIHDDVGYNFRLTNIQAAMGVAQLENIDKILKRKSLINDRYINGLKNSKEYFVPKSPDYSKNNHWLNLIKFKNQNKDHLQHLVDALELNGIQSRPVWHLNHLQKPYKSFQSYKIEVAYEMVSNSLCMPSSYNLTDSDLDYIIDTIVKL